MTRRDILTFAVNRQRYFLRETEKELRQFRIRSFKGRKVVNSKPIHGYELADEMFDR